MQNHAKVGGVLSIIAGSIGVLSFLFFICIAVVMLIIPGGFGDNYYYHSPGTPEGFFVIMAAIYIIIGISHVLIGALAIVGGVFALRKKHWGWALAGAIGGTIVFLPCGIPAIIFIAQGKAEFQKAAPTVSTAPMEKIVG
jgi:hypothetical protein